MSLPKELSFQLPIPLAPLTENPELFQEVLRIYNAIRLVAYKLDSYTGAIPPPTDDFSAVGAAGIKVNGMMKVYIIAFEDMVVGDTASFYDDAGTPKVRKGIDPTYRAHGFCSIAGLAGAVVEVTLVGLYPSYPAGTLTPGTTYFQSNVSGTIGAAGFQAVGFAINDTQLFFNPVIA